MEVWSSNPAPVKSYTHYIENGLPLHQHIMRSCVTFRTCWTSLYSAGSFYFFCYWL